MKKIVFASFACFVVAISFSGCASLQGGNPVEVQALPGGAAVGVNPTMLGSVWEWIKENPKTAITGAGAGGFGFYKLAQQQNWFGMGRHEDQASTSTSVSTSTTDTRSKTYTVNVGDIGNGSTVNIYNYAPITTTAP
jgi:hypothetical protein